MYFKLAKEFCMVLIFVFLFVNYCVQAQNGNASNLLLDRKLENVKIKGSSLPQILSDIAVTYKVPIGFDGVVANNQICKLEKPVEIEYKLITVSSLIESVYKSTSNCRWEVSEEVINFFSIGEKNIISETILNNFEIKQGDMKRDIKTSIVNSDEIHSALKSENKNLTFLMMSNSENRPISKDFSISKGNFSLRYILNQIVKKSDSQYWSLTTWEDESTVFVNF